MNIDDIDIKVKKEPAGRKNWPLVDPELIGIDFTSYRNAFGEEVSPLKNRKKKH